MEERKIIVPPTRRHKSVTFADLKALEEKIERVQAEVLELKKRKAGRPKKED
jgi:tetrahydromethanopterin S-methyltransferase subunit G